MGLGDGSDEGIAVGDGLGISEGLDVGNGVVGSIVGDGDGKRVGSHVSQVSAIHRSTAVALPNAYTLHKDTSVGGIFKNSPESSSYTATIPPSPVITQDPSSLQEISLSSEVSQ